MKKIIYIILAVLIIGGGFLLINKPSDNNASKSPAIIQQIASANGQLIDVRTVEEYTTSHADDAINVPLDDILNGNMDKIDKSRPVYVYCRSGNRSNQAKTALEQAGFSNVTDLGGLSSLQSDGVTVCSTSEPNC